MNTNFKLRRTGMSTRSSQLELTAPAFKYFNVHVRGPSISSCNLYNNYPIKWSHCASRSPYNPNRSVFVTVIYSFLSASSFIADSIYSFVVYMNGMSKADKRNKFLAVFECIRVDLIVHMKSEKIPEDGVTWFNKVSAFVKLCFREVELWQ